jgi:hypothetical protein
MRLHDRREGERPACETAEEGRYLIGSSLIKAKCFAATNRTVMKE